MGVLGREHRGAEVVRPRQPEQEALLAVARRVVGERVEQRVDDPERPREVRRRRRQVAQRRPQLAHGRQRRARERPDLVAQDRRRLGQERPRLAQRRAERAGGRPQVLERRAEHPSRAGRPWRASSASRRARRAARAAPRAGSRPGSRASRTPRWSSRTNSASCVSLSPSSSISSEKLWIDALDVPAPLGELLVDLARVAGGRLEPPDRARQLAAVALQARRAVAEQQPQVVARVRVERREDLVEVDVGQRLRDRDALALGQLARPRRAGVRARRPCPSARSWAAAGWSRRGRSRACLGRCACRRRPCRPPASRSRSGRPRRRRC